MSVDLVYETHSITLDNENGIATGWFDGALSDRGKQGAIELGRRRAEGFDACYTSDLARAFQTAAIAFEGSDLPVIQDARLREVNYGDLNGMTLAQLETERPKRIHVPFPRGESYFDVVARMVNLLNELRRDRDAEHILLIGHAATRFALEHIVHGTPLKEIVLAPVVWQPGWSYTFEHKPH